VRNNRLQLQQYERVHPQSPQSLTFVTSAKKDMLSCRCLPVCLLATLRKNFRTNLHEIFREGWQWDNEQMVKFWWRSGSPSRCRDCFPDSHYWEIRKVVNGHKSAAHTDSPDGCTGKTCLGVGMHCHCVFFSYIVNDGF